MNDLRVHLLAAYEALKSSNGEFILFAALMPEESLGKWDVVACATWLKNDLSSYERLVKTLERQLTTHEMQSIERTVILPVDNGLVQNFLEQHGGQEEPFLLSHFDFAGARIQRGFFIRAKPRDDRHRIARRKARPKGLRGAVNRRSHAETT